MKKDLAILADMVAIPFWIILILYSAYQISAGNQSFWPVLVVIAAALIADTLLVIHAKKK